MIASPILEAQPGDVWLFSGDDPVSRLISLKTWSRFVHAEVVLVNRVKDSGVEVFTSKVATGVEFYAPKTDGLALVLRPDQPFNQRKAVWWAYESRSLGQPYALLGLLAFWYAAWQGRRDKAAFCSEACNRFLRAGGIDLFPNTDSDTIAPGAFATNPLLHVVWRSAHEWIRWQERGEVS